MICKNKVHDKSFVISGSLIYKSHHTHFLMQLHKFLLKFLCSLSSTIHCVSFVFHQDTKTTWDSLFSVSFDVAEYFFNWALVSAKTSAPLWVRPSSTSAIRTSFSPLLIFFLVVTKIYEKWQCMKLFHGKKSIDKYGSSWGTYLTTLAPCQPLSLQRTPLTCQLNQCFQHCL